MNIIPALTDRRLNLCTGSERRSKPRIREPFRVTVYSMDACGEVYETCGLLDNMSADGLYMRLPQCLEPGTTLSITIRLSAERASTPCVAVHGVVLRSELKGDGTCGIAVTFTHHRFL